MRFNTKLILKKGFERNHIVFEKGCEFRVVFSTVNCGMELYHQDFSSLIPFGYDWIDREKRIEEYFEIVGNENDR